MIKLQVKSLLVVSLLCYLSPTEAQLPTLYEHFTQGGITEGLRADDRQTFTLNGKELKIFGGSFHYFRVHPAYWRDRLRKYRAAGLNAIDVYVPWNLHEPERGVFDFGSGGRDMSHFLDLPAFLRMAQEEDLFVIFRPGPYICAEWEFGGIPSWLLGEHPMHIRSSYSGYQDRAGIYLSEVLSRVADLQFYTAGGEVGGPIIMAQIENEYASFGYGNWPRDKPHLRYIKEAYEAGGFEDTLLFTSDQPVGGEDKGTVDGVLMTANFNYNGQQHLEKLLEMQPNRPLIVTEFWPGWFDHWFEDVHHTMDINSFTDILGTIFSYNSSVNFYMFHGGTNFGFLNGANLESEGLDYWPTITSYDYDAPLTESGEYTPKYDRAAEMIAAFDPLASLISKPDRPTLVPAMAYGPVQLTEYIDYNGIVDNVPPTHRQMSPDLLSMEELSVNNGNGQSYGYVVYRKRMTLADGAKIKIRGHVRDFLQLFVNGRMLNDPFLVRPDLDKFGSFNVRDGEFTLDLSQTAPCNPTCTLDLMVENLGRGNFGQPHQLDAQKKGLWQGEVMIDGVAIKDWEIIAMEFKGDWVQSLTGWQPFTPYGEYGPRVLRGTLTVPDPVPSDTYFDFDCANGCTDWLHGAVFVNGFNVGRYHQVGPQKTLYVPGPALNFGDNEIIIMENYRGSDVVQFTDVPNYGPI